MITLSIRNNLKSPKIAVVGALHGNETLGLDVYREIAANPVKYANLTVIVANVEAYKKQTRAIDEDLNRAFPGNADGSYEQRLAAQINAAVHDCDYLIDIHTTTSPGFEEVAITGPLTDAHKRIIQASGITEVTIMESKLLASSLIGSVRAGVSLEFGEEFVAKGGVVERILAAIDILQQPSQKAPALKVNSYDVLKTIPREGNESKQLTNFVFNDELGGYPFLADEVNYTAYRGFLLGEKTEIELA